MEKSIPEASSATDSTERGPENAVDTGASVTDGFDFYEKVVRRVLGPTALYGQVLKTRRNERHVPVERRELMGATWRFEEALNNSEDSSTLNTSFIERLNLAIRKARPICLGGRFPMLAR